MNGYTTLLWSWITSNQDYHFNICLQAIPQWALPRSSSFSMLFWWFFSKKERKKKSTAQKFEIKMSLFSSSIPGSDHWINTFTWTLGQASCLFPQLNTELNSGPIDPYWSAEQDTAVKPWKEHSHFILIANQKIPQFPTFCHPKNQNKRGIN